MSKHLPLEGQAQQGLQLQLRHGYGYGENFTLAIEAALPASGITAVFGPSGCGKTTLLRCIAGLERAAGELAVGGEVWQNEQVFLPSHKRRLGYVFQEASLFSHLDVAGNLHYARKRSWEAVSDAFFQQLVSMFSLAPLLERHTQHLSGGERQRVAIARALLMQPRLLLMDEPLAALDAPRKHEIMPYLERLHSDLDIPVLYVSHSMDEVVRLADHLMVLDQGRVTALGPLAEVCANLNWAVADAEAGVVLQGQATARDTQWHLLKFSFADACLWLRDNNEALHQALRLRVLARDVSLSLSAHEDSSILNRVQATVDRIEEDAASGMVLVRLRVGEQHLLARITQRSCHHLALTEGMPVWAQIKSVAIVR